VLGYFVCYGASGIRLVCYVVCWLLSVLRYCVRVQRVLGCFLC
jgi:hypothetical protein